MISKFFNLIVVHAGTAAVGGSRDIGVSLNQK